MKNIRFVVTCAFTATILINAHAAGVETLGLIGIWNVASVKEDGKEIVSAGSQSTVEFMEDGTFKALGGCNTMEPTQTYAVTGSKINFKPAGTKKGCASNVVEFWKLNKVTDFELQDEVLFLSYKTATGKPGHFRLEKAQK